MARYRIVVERHKWTDSWKNEKESDHFKVQRLRWSKYWFKWVPAAKKQGHPLWRVFETLEEAQSALEKFVEKKRRKKQEKSNPKVVFTLNTGWI